MKEMKKRVEAEESKVCSCGSRGGSEEELSLNGMGQGSVMNLRLED
jgi:hypothetical protein